VLDFLETLRGRSAGEALDTVWWKIQIRRWQLRTEIVVRCAGQIARLQARKASTDAEVIWQCFIGNQYEVPRIPNLPSLHHDAVQATYLKMTQSDETPLIVDCGANIGASTAWFDMRYPNSKIVAVEPAAANIALLQANCEGRDNISIVEAGVGPEDAEAYLQDNGGGHWGYQTSRIRTDRPVKIVSLPRLIETCRDATTMKSVFCLAARRTNVALSRWCLRPRR